MATGDKRVNIYQKKFMPQQQATENFMDYILKLTLDTRARVYNVQSGVFQQVFITASSNDTFDVSTANGIDDGGNEVNLPAGTGLNASIPFANATGTVYSVGMKYNRNRPSGTEANHRSRKAEYSLWEDVCGEVLEPDSVTDQTTKLKIVVDKPLRCDGAPITHAGRLATVWLKNPASTVEAVAIYDATVLWDGSNNYIEVPYSANQGPLGQTLPDYPLSTTAADYLVHIKGLTVTNKAALDLSAESDIAFLGEITGNGPAATPTGFDVSGQNILALAFGSFDLDGGYDGAGGSGSGRKIIVDSGAVELNGPVAGPGDEFSAFLRIINDDRNWDNGLDIVTRENTLGDADGSLSGQVIRAKYRGTDGVNMVATPFPQTGTLTLGSGNNTVTMPAGTYTNLIPGICMVDIKNSPALADDGTYLVNTVSGTTVTLRNLDGTVPSFNGSTASFSITLATNVLGGAWLSINTGGITYRRWQNAIIANPAAPGRAGLRVVWPIATLPADGISAIEVGDCWTQTSNQKFTVDYHGNVGIKGSLFNDMIPYNNNFVSLGSLLKKWAEVHCSYVYPTGIYVDNAIGQVQPSINNTCYLGSTSYRWAYLYANNAYLATLNVAGQSTMQDVDPATTNTYWLGDSGAVWAGIYANVVRLQFSSSYLDMVSGSTIEWQDSAGTEGNAINCNDMSLTQYRLKMLDGAINYPMVDLQMNDRTRYPLFSGKCYSGMTSVLPIPSAVGRAEVFHSENWRGKKCWAVDALGRVVKPHVYHEDFDYHYSAIGFSLETPKFRIYQAGSGGDAYANEHNNNIEPASNLILDTGATAFNAMTLKTPPMVALEDHASYGFQVGGNPCLHMRASFDSVNDVEYLLGFYNQSTCGAQQIFNVGSNERFYGFFWNEAIWEWQWKEFTNGGTDRTITITGTDITAYEPMDFVIWMEGYAGFGFDIWYWMTGMASPAMTTAASGSNALFWMGAAAQVRNQTTTPNKLWLDVITMWDDNPFDFRLSL